MTTIAYDGRYLSIDSQLTAGGRKMVGTKLLKATNDDGEKLVIAGCGTWREIKLFVEWLDGGSEEPTWDEFEALVAYPDGRVHHYQTVSEPLDVTGEPTTLGSGADYAMGALLSGKTAPEAVLVATQADLYSGGKVKTHDTRPEKTKKSVSRKKTLDK